MSKFRQMLNKGKARNKVELPKTEPVVLEGVEVKELLESIAEVVNAVAPEPALARELEAAVQPVAVATTDVDFLAHGICYNNTRKKYMLTTIQYNPTTGTSSVVSVKDWADSAPVALNKLTREIALKILKREDAY